ncbi:phosphoribosyl-AMP cyclohydrolase [Chloroflexota bacterium]
MSEAIKYNQQGLVPAIIQDSINGEVLMLGYMNAESIKLTIESGEAWFYSRSRQKLWHKGATSGNRIKVIDLKLDCDNDTILVYAEPMGPVCHTGNRSCFFKDLAERNLAES